MLKNKLVRSDGSIIDSSVIISCEFTEEVNSGNNLIVGNATASEIRVEIRSTDAVRKGDTFTYYIIEDDIETQVGVFTIEKAPIITKDSMRFSAYDNVAKTEKVISEWLLENQEVFPMTLMELATQACAYCGVSLAVTDFPNSDMYAGAFYADGVTCRQILSWIAAIAGRFVRANAYGELELAWYDEAISVFVSPHPANTEGVNLQYFRDRLTYETYTTDPILRVQINHADDDIGIVYPPGADGNCFRISNNMIAGTMGSDEVLRIAESLYTHLKDVSYVPFSVTVPKTIRVRAGNAIKLIDSNETECTSIVMKVSLSNGGTCVSSVGDESYANNTAIASEKYRNLTGKIMSIRKNVDELYVENKDLRGDVSSLQLDLDGISSQVVKNQEEVGGLKTSISQLQQSADGLNISIQNILQNGVDQVTTKTGYTFNADGLEITKSGEQMKNKLDNTGMVVSRSGTPILKATADGVEATDVKVNNYLIIGDNCRFEDYSNGTDSRRTACFFTG